MSVLWRRVVAAAIWSFAIAFSPAVASAEEFYAGKQINFIAGSAAGGGYDLLARLVTRHLGRHIPGNPSFVVQNMPAAGSIVAANLLANSAPRDGLTIGLLQRGVLLAGLTGGSQIQYDIAKFNWLASLNSEVGVTIARAGGVHKTTRDLFDKELIVGGVVGVDMELTPKLYNQMLGTKFKIVTGYNSTTDIGLAMERGELQGVGDWSWSSLNAMHPEWLRDSSIVMLLQGSLQPSADLGGLPRALDFARGDIERRVLELYFTQKTVARPVVAPPGVPLDRLDLLRRGFAALSTDREFLADAEKSKLEANLIDGAAVDKVIALIGATDERTRARYVEATR